MRKTLIYLSLAIRAVFLHALNSVWEVVSKPSKLLLRTSFVAIIILSSFNFEVLAQGPGTEPGIGNSCPPGQRVCIDGLCRPARQCGQGIPPPPGLPLDTKLPFLLIAGLGLGIYYWRSKKTA